jgi:AmiR/NasT family two-component response regulator
VIAAATGCGPEEAHRLLVQQSQHENRKVREIAAEIVERG